MLASGAIFSQFESLFKVVIVMRPFSSKNDVATFALQANMAIGKLLRQLVPQHVSIVANNLAFHSFSMLVAIKENLASCRAPARAFAQ